MRVLVCGTHYGSTYLRALHGDANGFQLAGILARSERSRDLAKQCGVPFFDSIDAVRDIEAACVAISGAAGYAITEALLGRGIHVLEEHPQGCAAIAAHRQTARSHRAVYHVNAHYSDIEAAAVFIATYRATAQRSRVLFANVLTNLRALWSAIEIVSRAAGPLYGIALTHTPAGPREFFTTSRSGPLTVHVQTVSSAVDDGSASWVSHNITAGFEEGVLTLAEAHGPVTWTPAPPSVAQLSASWNQPQWQMLAPPPPTLGEHLTAGRDAANRIALARFAAEILGGATPPEQSDTHLLGVAQVWESISQHTNLGA